VAGRPATIADDLYAVGVVGYEALCGQKPFPQENLASLVRAVAEDTPPPLHMLRPDVDPALAAAIAQAMARDPGWQFPTAEAMRGALFGVPQPNSTRPPTRVLAEPLPTPATVAVAASAPPRKARRLVILGAVLSAIALAAVLVVVESSPSPSPKPATVTSTSAPLPPPSVAPPPPPPAPAPIDQAPPRKKKGHGNDAKKGGHGDE
jgi:serine/threonine-protein kinase